MSKIRRSAQGEECQVRLPLATNHDPATVVLAHLNGGGMGMKNPDYQGAYACFDCHRELDRITRHLGSDFVKLCHLEGAIRTQEILRKKRLILIP